MENYELYHGAEILVDYKAQNNQDIIDYFEEQSNFEGYARLASINFEEGLFTVEGLPLDFISFEYLIAMNIETNEYEYVNGSKS